MKTSTSKPRKHNPVARALRSPALGAQVIPSKLTYTRKPKQPFNTLQGWVDIIVKKGDASASPDKRDDNDR